MRQLLKLIVVTPVLFCVSAYSQNNKLIDSLEKKISLTIPDTNKVNALISLAIEYSKKDSVKAIKNISMALDLSIKLNYTDGQIDCYNNLGVFYMDFSDLEKSLKYFKQTEALGIKYNKTERLVKLYSNMGNLYSDWHKSKEAISYYNKSIELGLKGTNKRSIAITYNNLGAEYIQNGDLQKATEYLLKSLSIREEINDQKGIANISSNISVLYKELLKYDEAIIYGNTAITTYRQLGLKIEEGRVCVNLGLIENRRKHYDKAEQYFDKALALFKGTTYTKGLAAVYNSRGIVLKNQNKLDEALANYMFSYELALSMKDKEAEVVSLIELGSLFLKRKNHENAEQKLLAALKIAKEINYLELQKDANETLASIYKVKGDYEKAFEYQTAFRDLADSISGKEKMKIIEDLKGKYETEKKELKITLLNKSDSIKSLAIANQQIAINKNLYDIATQKLALADAGLQLADDSLQLSIKNETILQNRLDSTQKEERIQDLNKQKRIQELEVNRKNIAIITLSVFTVLILLLGYSFYKRRILQQQAIAQATLAKQQQQATIEIINAEEKERKRIAEDLHDGVGQLMTAAWLNLQALDNQTQADNTQQYQLINKTLLLVDESCKEVRQVSHNMMPNALLRKGLVNAVKEFIGQINTGKLSINLQTEELQKALPSHVETILYRVIQESVNNVVKHAEATQLDISINQDEEGIDVMVEDNGKGFDAKIIRPSDGIGLQNIQSRILYLKGTVSWDSSPNNGTLVAIHIPANA